MNDEKLIEIVRKNTVLYDLENSKYSDNQYKENIWSEISKELNVSLGSTCKNRWNQLRDQWRKNKKKQLTKSGQGNKPIKKWRYDEQMEFLNPFSCLRETIGNLNDIGIECEENERDENIHSTEPRTQENNVVPEAQVNTEVVTNSDDQTTSTPIPKRQRFYLNKKEQPKRKQDESATGVLMKYLIEKQKAEQSNIPAAKDSIDLFFESMAAKVKRFTPYYRNIAETKIFNLVQDMELEQIQPTNQEPIASNNSSFHNLLPLQPSTHSHDNSNSKAASYIASFYDDSNIM